MSFYISPLVSQAMSSIIFTFGTAVGLVTVLVIASMSTDDSQLVSDFELLVLCCKLMEWRTASLIKARFPEHLEQRHVVSHLPHHQFFTH